MNKKSLIGEHDEDCCCIICELEQDPEAKWAYLSKPKDICGLIKTVNGREWICIKAVHDKAYTRKNGTEFMSNNPDVNKHYFVRRFPNDIQEDTE